MNILLLINEQSGTVQQRGPDKILAEITEPFVQAGHSVDAIRDDAPGLLSALTSRTAAAPPDLVVSAGGDGTIAAIATVLKETEIALFPAPAGTMNMLATDLGYNQQIDIAARQAAGGKIQKADVALVNDEVFMNNVVIGTFAEIADIREEVRETGGILKDLSVAADVTQTLMAADPERFVMTVDGKKTVAVTNTLMVSNNLFSGMAGIAPARERIDEGVLGLYQFKSRSGNDFMSIIAQTMMGHIDSMDQVTVTRCKTCEIDFKGQAVPYSIDGEPKETGDPMVFRVIPGALTLWVPQI